MRYRVTWEAGVEVEADNPYTAAREAAQQMIQMAKGSITLGVSSPDDPEHVWWVDLDPWVGPEGVVSHVGTVREYDTVEF